MKLKVELIPEKSWGKSLAPGLPNLNGTNSEGLSIGGITGPAGFAVQGTSSFISVQGLGEETKGVWLKNL